MPLIVKPLAELNTPGPPHNSLRRRNDGFDPLVPYQMIPIGGTREMVVETGDFKAEMQLIEPDITSMSNFRILKEATPKLFPLPGPGVEVRRLALPERSTVQFTLSGRKQGMTTLEGRDRPVGGPPLKKELDLLISVKGPISAKVAVCHLFDRIHPDKGAHTDFSDHLAEAHRVFFDQANMTINNIDGNGAVARAITISGTIGKTFGLLDRDLIRKITSEIEAKHPSVLRQAQIIVLPSPVPLVVSKKDSKDNRPIGMGVRWIRSQDSRGFTFVILGPQLAPQKASKGGGVSPARIFRNTLIHELGHCLGLRHHPSEFKDLPPALIGKDINPAFFQSKFHNLMFPGTLVVSDSINFAQVEQLHRLAGPVREFTF